MNYSKPYLYAIVSTRKYLSLMGASFQKMVLNWKILEKLIDLRSLETKE
tara:strand:- start:445 stop:591 length:147 start_codon:yes stop_codon:yes gene_type:complete